MEKKVDAKLVKQLRDETGAGYKDCMDCLMQANQDIELAKKYLHEKGISRANKVASNSTSQGKTGVLIKANVAVIAELNCQTDFVARNPEFKNLLEEVLNFLIQTKPVDLATATTALKDKLLEAIAKIKENIVLTRFELFEAKANQFFGSYNHDGGKYTGIVVLEGPKNEEVADNIAMQLVSMNPSAIDIDDVDPKLVEMEKEIIEKQLVSMNKPEEIKAKIRKERLIKILAPDTLNNQNYILDDKMRVSDYLNSNKVTVVAMKRYEVGGKCQ